MIGAADKERIHAIQAPAVGGNQQQYQAAKQVVR
jgi:hypothetical protein